MARYKEFDYSQGKFIPIHFDRQILPGTFEYSLHYLIDNEIDLSIFDCRYGRRGSGLAITHFIEQDRVASIKKLARIFPAKPSASLKRKNRRGTANTGPAASF
jgi:hypothetical protein